MRTPRAILHLNAAYLKQLLQIPEEAEIDGITLDFYQTDLVQIRINGAGWITRPGYQIMNTTGIVREGAIDWQLPQQETEA